MEYFLIGVGMVFLVGGIIGCFLPILPGPGLCYLALLTIQFKTNPPFQLDFLLTWAGISIAVTVLDYLLPPWVTKKFGGSKKGVVGSIIGLILGLVFFPPFGILIGPMVGALLGEMVDGKGLGMSFRAAIGALSGFMAGMLVKLCVCAVMGYYFFINL